MTGKYFAVIKNLRLPTEEAVERTAERYEFRTYADARAWTAGYTKNYALHGEIFKRLPGRGADGLRVVSKCCYDFSGDRPADNA